MYLFMLSLLLASVPSGGFSQPSEGCTGNISTSNGAFRSYMLRGNPIPFNAIKLTISTTNRKRMCHVNLSSTLDQVVNPMQLPGRREIVRVISLTLRCVHRTRLKIQLSSHPSIYIGKIIGRVTIQNCEISLKDIENIGKATNMWTVHLIDTLIVPRMTRSRPTSGSRGFHALLTFAAANALDHQSRPNSVERLFPPAVNFSSVAQLILKNMSLSTIPPNLDQRFPHLQYLDLSWNNLKRPPTFPWDSEMYQLPANISKVEHYENQCIKKFGIHVPPTIFMRAFILDCNNITSLVNFTFHGFLHLISISGNGLRSVSENTFADTENLQFLNLSDNALEEMPGLCSSRPCQLRVLDLDRNLIQSVNHLDFRNLTNLLILRMSFNKLRSLEQFAFRHLVNLTSLYLDHNELSFIHIQSLPSSSTELQYIYLQHNPLVSIPSAVFTLSGFRFLDISFNKITLEHLNRTLDDVSFLTLKHVVYKQATRLEDHQKAQDIILKRRREYTRKINLSKNLISTIPVLNTSSVDERDKLEFKYRILLVNYQIDLTENPLSCNCRMADFIAYIQNHTDTHIGTFTGTEYFFTDWRCSSPREYMNKPMLSLSVRDLYCKVEIRSCPTLCTCSSFVANRGYVTDCQMASLTSMPIEIPERTRDLRLQGNNITTLSKMEYLGSVEKLNLSNSGLTRIDENFLTDMYNLSVLFLDHNALRSLPLNIRDIRELSSLTLGHNQFRCDCHNLWLKSWLLQNRHLILDFDDIFCVMSDEKVSLLVEVEDEDFVCLSKMQNTVFVVTISVSVIVVVFLSLGVIIYRYHLEIRVLLYAQFNIRPFKISVNAGEVDVISNFVVIAEEDSQWAEENVLGIVQTSGPTDSIVLAFQDFIAGLSIEENMSLMVKHSYRMIVIVSQNFLSNEWCVLALEKAFEKTRQCHTQYLVLVERDHLPDLKSNYPRLKSFLKSHRGQFIGYTDRLRKEKISYFSQYERSADSIGDFPKWWEILHQSISSTPRACTHDVFVAYDDSDYTWAVHDVMGKLEGEGFSTCLADRNFIPGESLQDNILAAVQHSRYVLLILSAESARSEWSLFILRIAYEVSLRERYNFLIVIQTENLYSVIEDEDMLMYLRTHTHLERSDPDWWSKLKRALSGPHASPSSLVQEHGDSSTGAVSISEITSSRHELISSCLTSAHDDVSEFIMTQDICTNSEDEQITETSLA